jgi:phage tail-like protein
VSALAEHPYEAFNFAVEITVPGIDGIACSGAFAECDGLEMTIDVKTIKEGGNNASVIRLAGGAGYGTLTLKRGVTGSFDLWNWMAGTVANPGLRGTAGIVVFSPDRRTERAHFHLDGCVPVRLKAPALNAKDGIVAIEELGLVYERLSLIGS